jgi:hypothetical protein
VPDSCDPWIHGFLLQRLDLPGGLLHPQALPVVHRFLLMKRKLMVPLSYHGACHAQETCPS